MRQNLKELSKAENKNNILIIIRADNLVRIEENHLFGWSEGKNAYSLKRMKCNKSDCELFRVNIVQEQIIKTREKYNYRWEDFYSLEWWKISSIWTERNLVGEIFSVCRLISKNNTAWAHRKSSIKNWNSQTKSSEGDQIFVILIRVQRHFAISKRFKWTIFE